MNTSEMSDLPDDIAMRKFRQVSIEETNKICYEGTIQVLWIGSDPNKPT